MNKKVLTLAVATSMVASMAANADVNISGIVQAEILSLEIADGNNFGAASIRDGSFENMDRQTLTNDYLGTVLNEGPNQISFEFDENLGGGLSAEARYVGAFNTSGNYEAGFTGQEAWIGLKTSNFHARYGTLTGVYKSSQSLVDPWTFTSLQARSTGGGMSGEYSNQLRQNVYNAEGEVTDTQPISALTELKYPDDSTKTERILQRDADGIAMYSPVTSIDVSHHDKAPYNGLTNDGFVEGALELGIHYSGFAATIQGVVDDASSMDGAGLLELRYTAPQFTLWLSGAYQDLDDATTSVTNVVKSDEEENKGLGNWKIGGEYKAKPMLKFGIQYEEAEIGAIDSDINSDGGDYILGSVEFKRNNISVAAWVAGYISDINDNLKMRDDDGNLLDEDALSFAIGVKYHFSKRTMVYSGYRQMDSDNDYRDENVATMGVRHVF